jgi:hypothetical protein
MTGCHDDQVITALKDYQTVHDGAAQIKLSIVTGKMPKIEPSPHPKKMQFFVGLIMVLKNN